MNNVQNECLSEKKQEVKIKNTVLFFLRTSYNSCNRM